ncbi:hypothetical protein PBY51_013078 [Eleginops maclovinus]|uniref:Uncharacterized protein n=1 Tax=Eleginops maclovinus TaxID=56733 RepID=A0AAN8ARE0_ELEMC|nr:hypothetical protein PBY51_013078 [Eleginops maclovinus]
MPSTGCPMCGKDIIALSQHLRCKHRVHNKEEKAPLLLLANGRVDIRKEPCPVPGCLQHTCRLDRHIHTHTELSRKERAAVLRSLKRRVFIARSAKLRTTNLAIPMVSRVDLEDSQEEGGLKDGEGRQEEEDGGSACTSTGCATKIESLKATIVGLTDALELAQDCNRKMQKRYKDLGRKLAAMRRKASIFGTPGLQAGPLTSFSSSSCTILLGSLLCSLLPLCFCLSPSSLGTLLSGLDLPSTGVTSPVVQHEGLSRPRPRPQ